MRKFTFTGLAAELNMEQFDVASEHFNNSACILMANGNETYRIRGVRIEIVEKGRRIHVGIDTGANRV